MDLYLIQNGLGAAGSKGGILDENEFRDKVSLRYINLMNKIKIT